MNQLDSVAESNLLRVNEYFAQAARADSRLRYETSQENQQTARHAASLTTRGIKGSFK